MAKFKLFQYVIIFEPTDKEIKEGLKAKIIKDVVNVLAAEEKNVAILAAREIPAEYLDKLEQINIAICPF